MAWFYGRRHRGMVEFLNKDSELLFHSQFLAYRACRSQGLIQDYPIQYWFFGGGNQTCSSTYYSTVSPWGRGYDMRCVKLVHLGAWLFMCTYCTCIASLRIEVQNS